MNWFLCVFVFFVAKSALDMPYEIEITVGDVNDVEARVFAKLKATGASGAVTLEPVVLQGTLRGPFCDAARTLPAEFTFRPMQGAAPPVVEAYVPDPCVWSLELPHVYYADVEARQGERVVAEYRGPIGFRKAVK
jgi:hypothetical protein